MLDITQLRRDLPGVVARLNARKTPQPFLDVGRFSALEAERKTSQTRTEELQARRNSLSRQIGQNKGRGEDSAALMAEVAGIADEMKAGADRLAYSYWATHDVPVIVTRASNNYGPYQFPEKILPLFGRVISSETLLGEL